MVASPTADMTYLVAHRAGNDLDDLARAARHPGVELVEADLRWFHGRVVVRHLKSIGPLPIYWDRGRIGRPFARHLHLDELLDSVGADTVLLLDLKGRTPKLARAVRAALEARPGTARTVVCARHWPLLDAFAAMPQVERFCSIGSRRGLGRLARFVRRTPVDGVSIHADLLDADVVAELRADVGAVLTWPVNSIVVARRLSMWGVSGLITDEPERLASITTQAQVPA